MKLTHALCGIVLALALLTAPQAADLPSLQLNRELATPVTRYATTDGMMALRIQYIGPVSIGGASVRVDAAGDLFFTADATVEGTIVADTTVSTDGQIDVSGASEDTYGEIIAAINASPNWRAILVDALPSFSANDTLTSTTGGLASWTANLTEPSGKPLYVDTAALDKHALSIGPEHLISELNPRRNLADHRATPSRGPMTVSELYYTTGTATYSSGAPNFQVYAVKDDTAGAAELLLWSQVGAASTEGMGIDLTDLPPIKSPPGWRLVVVINDTSTPDITAATLQVHGLVIEQ